MRSWGARAVIDVPLSKQGERDREEAGCVDVALVSRLVHTWFTPFWVTESTTLTTTTRCRGL